MEAQHYPSMPTGLHPSLAQPKEKTYIDKITGRIDNNATRELIRKDILTRSEMRELLILMASPEVKFFNLNPKHWYYLMNFSTWVNDFANIAEQVYDYQARLYRMQRRDVEKLQDTYKKIAHLDVDAVIEDLNNCLEYPTKKPHHDEITTQIITEYRMMSVSKEARHMFFSTMDRMTQILKRLLQMFHLISRSSLSIDGGLIKSIIEQKFDINYATSAIPQQKETGVLKGRY